VALAGLPSRPGAEHLEDYRFRCAPNGAVTG
jgi:hypothetical protein